MQTRLTKIYSAAVTRDNWSWAVDGSELRGTVMQLPKVWAASGRGSRWSTAWAFKLSATLVRVNSFECFPEITESEHLTM